MARPLPLAVLLAAAASPAGWLPDSPIIRAGEDVDVYFTAKGRLEYNSNLFLDDNNGLPSGGASWTLGPGLSADFFKESMFSSSVQWRRDFVRYFDSALSGLHDDQDNGSASFTYDGGGPLTAQIEASYGENASNRAQEQIPGITPSGTLLRSTNYSQSAAFGYAFTDKLSLNFSATHSSNRYDPRLKVVDPAVSPPPAPEFNTQGLTESDGWNFPLGINYRVRERLSVGLTYEHGHTDISAARGSTAPAPATGGFTKDFYGVTLSGPPTESGKLDVMLKAGLLRSVYDDGSSPKTSPSYAITLTHQLSEKTNHALSLKDDASVAVNGLRNVTRSANYTYNWVASEAFRASASAGISLSKVDSSTSDISTGSYGLTATYTPDRHWTCVASYTLTQAYRPDAYNVHLVALEANLRW